MHEGRAISFSLTAVEVDGADGVDLSATYFFDASGVVTAIGATERRRLESPHILHKQVDRFLKHALNLETTSE